MTPAGRVLLIPTDVLEALLALRRADVTARLAAPAAAELHLGHPLVAPVPVTTRRPLGELPPRLLRAERHGPAQRGDLHVEGVRVPDLEATVVALAASESRASVDLIAALIGRGSVLEGRAVDATRLARRAALHDDRAVTARIAWWCFRLDAPTATIAAPPGERVLLSPTGPRDAPRLARFGLVLNAADGLADPDGVAAEELAQALTQRRHVADLAVLFDAGLALSARGVSGPAARSLERLASYGYVVPEGKLLRPKAPFEGACTRLAAGVSDRSRRALLADFARRLREPAHADEAVARMLAAVHLGLGDGALAYGGAHPLAEASPAALGRLVAALPARAQRTLARKAPGVFERLGLWDDLARFVAADLTRAKGAARGRALVIAATVAWRRDRVQEARAHLAEAEASPSTKSADRLEATLLRATLDAEAGAFEPAALALRDALSTARAAGDARVEAQALHRLGTVDARRGRLRDALARYEEALARCPPDARALRGVLLSNSAAIELWTGRTAAAAALARAAWAERSAVGSPSERVATRVLTARIDAASGHTAPPGGRMLPLAWEAERSGSPRLAVEVWLDAAVEFAAAGRHEAARDAIDRARRMLVQLEGAEPALAGLVDEADGWRRLAQGDAPGALAPLQRAVTALTRLGAVFFATRARLALASVRLALGDEGSALREVTRVARACDEGELALGTTAEHAAAFALAAVAGDAGTRRHAERVLAQVDATIVDRALARDADVSLAARFAARRQGFRSAARTASSGQVRDVDARALTRLRDGSSGAVVVDLRDATLLMPGRPAVSLLRRRMLTPLLVCLARAPEVGVTVDDLAARVWQRRPSPSTRTAVKVAISRLRAVLGPYAVALEPTRIGGAAGYHWRAARAPLIVVLDATEGISSPTALPARTARSTQGPLRRLCTGRAVRVHADGSTNSFAVLGRKRRACGG